MVQTLSKVKPVERIESELRNGRAALDRGNHGMARVCARRAAGWAIQIWLAEKGVDLQTPSAFDYIKHLNEQTDNPDSVRQVLKHLIAKAEHAENSEEHIFPVATEFFLKEAHWLCEQMVGQPITVTV